MSTVTVMYVDGNLFINQQHITSFKNNTEQGMDCASDIVAILEKYLDENNVEFLFNTDLTNQETQEY